MRHITNTFLINRETTEYPRLEIIRDLRGHFRVILRKSLSKHCVNVVTLAINILILNLYHNPIVKN
jgi:hypothetical protein